MATIAYMDLYDETQAEGGADSCKYMLKDIQASVNFTDMTILWHQLRQNKSKRQA